MPLQSSRNQNTSCPRVTSRRPREVRTVRCKKYSRLELTFFAGKTLYKLRGDKSNLTPMNNMNKIRRHVLMFGDITGLTGFQLFLDQWMAWFFYWFTKYQKNSHCLFILTKEQAPTHVLTKITENIINHVITVYINEGDGKLVCQFLYLPLSASQSSFILSLK